MKNGEATTTADRRKPSKPGKKPSKPGKKPAQEKEEGGKDRFGSRLGTVRAKFNAALDQTPKTHEQIAEETGYPAGRVLSYLKDLSARDKRVIKVKEGWRLKG